MSTVLSHHVVSSVLRLCEDLGTPVGKEIKTLLSTENWDKLANFEVNPRHYDNPYLYRRDAILGNLLRKVESLPTSYDKKARAIESFWSSEKECYSSNERLGPYLWQDKTCLDPAISILIDTIRKELSSILGPCPDLVEGRFGPGTTFADKGSYCTVPDKMSSRPTLTSDALHWLFQWSGTAWASACASSDRDPQFVRGNRFTTVPKDGKKDRGICIEPSVNLFYQLGYGKVLKRRLKREGLDLARAQNIHRRVACEASISGDFATIDLSNASDTMCTNLVKLLLPYDWNELLSSLRSPFTLLKDKWVKLEKFSSMGNGFTFELETLLFYAISKAVMQLLGHKPEASINVYVFGDDIIVPTQSAPFVIKALQFFGFSTNKDKTFVDGPFRESCGGDFFRGVDVRPFFLKKDPCEPQEYIAFANGIRNLGCNDPSPDSFHRDYRRAWFCILDALPSNIRRCRGPRALGDIVIHDDQLRWETRTRSCIRYVQVYRVAKSRKVGWQHFRPDVVLACAVYGTGDGRPKNFSSGVGRFDDSGVTPRDSVIGYKIGWVPYS